jgi:putative endonuclease
LPGLTLFVIAGLDPAIHHQEMSYWVYILASRPGGTLYVGVTNDLVRRTYEHREGLAGGFTKKYDVKQLVYFEQHETIAAAIQREKNIKHWSREWKVDLIASQNPDWRDLYDEIVR